MRSALLIDENLLTREGLKYLLSREYPRVVLDEARNDKEARAKVAMRPWDLVVLDVSHSTEDGFRLLGDIRRHYPAIPVLVMSTQAELLYGVRAKKAGAKGYAGKDAARADLVRAIRNVLSGDTSFESQPRENAELLRKLNSLSPREYRVMLALGNGKRATDIATDLDLNVRTISTYKRRVLNKLQLRSTADLVRHVIDHKLC
ncbi:MAG TPA: response regulator transcription factor [Bryobacteraceae bacterium]|jgi:DNA-binding NarL/FixJ family response regulator|nr:response regulator transcription factor [Bryobacteraceae bacterium]